MHDGAQAVREVAVTDTGQRSDLWSYVWAGSTLLRARYASSDDWLYAHQDRLGSVVLWTFDDSGALSVAGKRVYEPYGKKLPGLSTWNLTDIGVPEPAFGFAGQRRDDEAKAYLMGARWYDVEMGRFLQLDPIGAEGGLNLYAYANASPTLWVDPGGLRADRINSMLGTSGGGRPAMQRQWSAGGVRVSRKHAAWAQRKWSEGAWDRAFAEQEIVGLAKEKGTTYRKAAQAVAQAGSIAAGLEGEQNVRAIASDLLSGKSVGDIVANIDSYTLGEGGDPQAVASGEAGEGATGAPVASSGPRKAMHLAFDFSDATLTGEEKHGVMVATREKYRVLGLVVTASPMSFDEARRARQAGENVFPVKFQDEPLINKQGEEVLGYTDPWGGEWSKVSLARAPANGRVTWLANVAGHEIGHQVLWKLERQFLFNEHHETAYAGSLMEPVPTREAAILSEGPRFFDAEDARKLAEHWGGRR